VTEILTKTTYDYIIAGGGMAGLSLAFLLNESSLRDKKILVIDREIKNQNDHTWCFWENGKGNFEEIVYRKWNSVWFHGTNNFSKLLPLENYNYKMIRAVDFYQFIFTKLNQNNSFTIIQADILDVENGFVKSDKGDFEAREFVFDSSHKKSYDNPKYQNMAQPFLGFVIETGEDVFEPNEATLFDFRIEQKGECRFVYVLPISSKKALVEFTIFAKAIPERSEFESELKKYIRDVLKIENYEISEREFGVIPMSDEPHEQFPSPKTIRIGTSGGYVKASTGYSFQRTQRRLKNIVKLLENRQKLETKKRTWKSFMDSVLLNVLLTGKHSADDVFTHLFERNRAKDVLKFLDEDTRLAEDYGIMRSVPIVPFSKAAIETIFKKLK
jgi:lycopene beta-cyclase